MKIVHYICAINGSRNLLLGRSLGALSCSMAVVLSLAACSASPAAKSRANSLALSQCASENFLDCTIRAASSTRVAPRDLTRCLNENLSSTALFGRSSQDLVAEQIASSASQGRSTASPDGQSGCISGVSADGFRGQQRADALAAATIITRFISGYERVHLAAQSEPSMPPPLASRSSGGP